MRPYNPGDNIFQTGADQRFNSFSDPSVLAFNQAGGQWGVNPNLLTPAYTAAYRPTYNTAQGNPFGGPSPGFAQSVNQVFNPFAAGGVNYGGNTYQQQSPYYDTLGYNPLDRTASIAQKWVVPGFASWISYKYLAKPLGAMGEKFTAGAITGMASGTFSAGTVATMGSWGGRLGGFAAGTLLPILPAATAVWGADKALFDPYIAQRQMTNDLRRNFAGVSFSDQSGNEVTGKGFSRRAAGEISRQMSMLGARDFSFNQSEVASLMDLSARSGLLDTVQGGQIADRMRAIVKQVKTVMQVGNTSDFKEAIEILSKLQMSGVGTKDVSSVLTRLGGMASVAGVSLQKMMATVGAQGEYLFASNGMTPYVGQLTAANAYGAFSAAQRTGLMSPALLARMGGVEGATQSATAGLLAMAQSPYARMSAFNRYMGGGTTGTIIGDISRFGGNMAANPITNIGRFEMYGPEIASKSLEEGGLARQIDDAIRITKLQNPAAAKGDGTVDEGALYMTLTRTIGMPHDQALGILMQQKVAQNPAAQKIAKAGLQTAAREAYYKNLENNGFGYGVLTPYVRPVITTMHNIQAATAESIGNIKLSLDRTVDNFEKGWMRAKFGDTPEYLGMGPLKTLDTASAITGGATYTEFIKNRDKDWINSKLSAAVMDVQNNEDVITAIEKGDTYGLKKVLMILAQDRKIDSRFEHGEYLDVLVDVLMRRKITTKKAKEQLTNEQITGISDKTKANDLVGLMEEYAKAGGKIAEPKFLERYEQATGRKIKDLPSLRKELATMAGRYAGKTGSQLAASSEGSILSDIATGQQIRGYEKLAKDVVSAKKVNFEESANLQGLNVSTDKIMVQGNVTVIGNTNANTSTTRPNLFSKEGWDKLTGGEPRSQAD